MNKNNKKLQMTPQLSRRFIESFPCIECGFTGSPYLPTSAHEDGCQRGRGLSAEDSEEIRDIWVNEFQIFLNERKDFVKPSRRCSICRSGEATGTVWVAYHDDSKGLVIVAKNISCDDCSFGIPSDWTEGRRWGFASVVTKENWELMSHLEKVGIA